MSQDEREYRCYATRSSEDRSCGVGSCQTPAAYAIRTEAWNVTHVSALCPYHTYKLRESLDDTLAKASPSPAKKTT